MACLVVVTLLQFFVVVSLSKGKLDAGTLLEVYKLQFFVVVSDEDAYRYCCGAMLRFQ